MPPCLAGLRSGDASTTRSGTRTSTHAANSSPSSESSRALESQHLLPRPPHSTRRGRRRSHPPTASTPLSQRWNCKREGRMGRGEGRLQQNSCGSKVGGARNDEWWRIMSAGAPWPVTTSCAVSVLIHGWCAASQTGAFLRLPACRTANHSRSTSPAPACSLARPPRFAGHVPASRHTVVHA